MPPQAAQEPVSQDAGHKPGERGVCVCVYVVCNVTNEQNSAE